jgi:hypothetical protein
VTNTRTPRDNESREEVGRPTDRWVPPTNLPKPKDTDEWRYYWVRTSMLGHSDNANVSSRFREGWVPCKAEDHPELRLESDRNSQFKGNIEVGGLLLCKISQDIVRQRRAYYENLARQQMESVDSNFMREQDPRMPLYKENSSRTSFKTE